MAVVKSSIVTTKFSTQKWRCITNRHALVVASKWMCILCTDPSCQNWFIPAVHCVSCSEAVLLDQLQVLKPVNRIRTKFIHFHNRIRTKIIHFHKRPRLLFRRIHTQHNNRALGAEILWDEKRSKITFDFKTNHIPLEGRVADIIIVGKWCNGFGEMIQSNVGKWSNGGDMVVWWF